VLFYHEPHQPRNVNRLQEAEQAASGFNTRVAVTLTKGVGTMWTAYAFVVLAFIGFFAILGLLNPIVALLVAWASQTFLQLVFLPIIMVGQNVLRRKTELQADEQFSTTMSTYHDIEQVMNHLSAQNAELLRLTKHLLAQDAELLRHAHLLMHLLAKNGISLEQLAAEGATTTMSLSVKRIVISKHQASSTIFAPISIISMKKNKDPHLTTGGPLMTRFTLKRNLTIINVEAELHSVPYPLPDSSSVLQNNTERFPRYSSKLASIFPGSSPSTKYQFLAA
jgi:uncharacterized membrane protein